MRCIITMLAVLLILGFGSVDGMAEDSPPDYPALGSVDAETGLAAWARIYEVAFASSVFELSYRAVRRANVVWPQLR